MLIIIFIILFILAFGLFPIWPYSRRWGYYPAGIIALLIIVLFIFLLLGFITV